MKPFGTTKKQFRLLTLLIGISVLTLVIGTVSSVIRQHNIESKWLENPSLRRSTEGDVVFVIS